MPKRKVGPLPSANNSFVNTLMNHRKFMKKKDKYRQICTKRLELRYYENIDFYQILFFNATKNDFNSHRQPINQNK